MDEISSGGVGFEFDISKYLSGIQGITGSDTGAMTGSDVDVGGDFNIDKYTSFIQGASGSSTGGMDGSWDGLVPADSESGWTNNNNFLQNALNIISEGGEAAKKLWNSLGPAEKKTVLAVGGGLLNNIYQSKATKELMNMKISGEKELLQERARLEKESEDRKVRRSAHAPVGTQFADTGLLNATMLMRKK